MFTFHSGISFVYIYIWLFVTVKWYLCAIWKHAVVLLHTVYENRVVFHSHSVHTSSCWLVLFMHVDPYPDTMISEVDIAGFQSDCSLKYCLLCI